MFQAVKRVVLDVNVLMGTLQHTGPISSFEVLATVDGTGSPAVNSINVVKAIAQQVLSGSPEFQVHVTPHVWRTLEYKLADPTAGNWSAEDAASSVQVLIAMVESMYDFGWTTDTEGDHTFSSLNAVVPTSFRKGVFDIDNEDRKVLVDMIAVAELLEFDQVPCVTILVTNDGGLQGTSDYVSKRYQSFAAEMLPQSVMVMVPKDVARFLVKSPQRRYAVAA